MLSYDMEWYKMKEHTLANPTVLSYDMEWYKIGGDEEYSVIHLIRPNKQIFVTFSSKRFIKITSERGKIALLAWSCSYILAKIQAGVLRKSVLRIPMLVYTGINA